MSEVPDEIRRLAAEREKARAARDFASADALRDAIAELGFRVIDTPQGPSFEPLAPGEPEVPRRLRGRDIESVLEEPPTHDVSVHWVCEGWPQDIIRALAGFRASGGGRDIQYVVADVAETDPAIFGDGVEVLPLEPGTGWGAARNAGLKRSRGRIVLVMDGSVEPTGDVFGPLEETLADQSVGVCGPFGIVTIDLQRFEESSGPEVDAIEGYLMAFRHDVLRDVGLFDEKFKWYRTADIECSFRVKDAGLRAMVVDVPVAKHEHRMWFETAPAERGKWSKRNYYRFLEKFRGRFDLLVSGPPEP